MTATPATEYELLAVPRPLLLSLRPRFAQAILDGTKTVELRRTRVSAVPGTLLVLYASSPVMAVVGVATLTDRDTASPATIWRRYRNSVGVSRAEFSDYFTGAEHATALSIGTPRALPEPLTLNWLRTYASFQPPQSYRYIAPTDPTPLADLAATWAN
ncbi:ASCH domain-containing protein [Nocardia cyriacigeorgica]|uniref:ASCH domain-containing protein n=1 Tax=Nocardia cyriacigeorgica TaxID=135487 RepID=A0A6P1CXN0_9NOCA|nr:ASCH domain-containing protein [Nocardia cyriacigeorgica]MBF6426075.1 ASCH domain-containing protein [Nocardia cyriacigeorgica]NEW36264.1 ASCH domain-containing protein [Nocardia cyriacigeorgica]